ncbi:MAG: DNA-3-methyladenine glycosylase 2 family protein [Actinomycetota bacterium]|nr:DNA-3-methyladenine glycosylase 2 family protein [Actinomycetota bacterium]
MGSSGEWFELRALGTLFSGGQRGFWRGSFAPAAYVAAEAGHLHMAFVADGGEEEVAGVCVREEGGVIFEGVFGEADPGVVGRQMERILSLDADGRNFPGVGEPDPVVGRLQARYLGLRPVGFYSPYEAAAWALVGQRVPIVRAARIKARMAEEPGPTVRIHGGRERAFPGLFGRKVEYLRRLGREAAAGKLDAAYLRSLPSEEAWAGLRELPSVGPFSAELILLRGAGEPDHLPFNELRLVDGPSRWRTASMGHRQSRTSRGSQNAGDRTGRG